MDENNENRQPTEEEIDELLQKIKELEEQNKQKNKRPRGFFTIEFGGAYHPNMIVNFLFSLIMNISLSYLIINVFDFASYTYVLSFVLFIIVYSIIESIIKEYVIRRHLQLVIRSFGMIFYFSYIVILFVLDRYVFVGTFTFNHEVLMVAFISIFVVVRYFLGTSIRRYFRRQSLR